MPPKNQEIHLRDYYNIIQKRKWTVLTFLFITVIIVTIGSFKIKPVYKSTAQIVIEKENPNVLSFKEVMSVDTSDTDYYQTQYKIIASRSLARSVIKQLDLGKTIEFGGEPDDNLRLLFKRIKSIFTPEKTNLGGDEQDSDLVDSFLEKLEVEPVRNSRLVNISFKGHDPAIITKVANTMAEMYIEQNMGRLLDAEKQAAKWLMDQTAQMKENVENSEQALQKYMEDNIIMSMDMGEKQSIMVQRLSELSTVVIESKAKRIELETRYNQLKQFANQPEMIESLPSVINNELIKNIKNEYVNLERRYSELSQKYKLKHPEMLKLEAQIKTVKKKIDLEVQKIANGLKVEYAVAKSREESLKSSLEEQKKEALELNQKTISYEALKRESESNKQMYDILIKRFKETSIAEGLKNTNIRIIDPAEVPRYPVFPKKKLNILLSLIVGLMGGVGLSFFFEYLDSTIKSKEDVDKHLDMPTLGLIPAFPKKIKDEGSHYLIHHDPKSPITEAYRSIRTNILFSSVDRLKCLLVTSSISSEGKSTTLVNLGITLAQSKRKTLIVDADLRKPNLHNFLGKNEIGLSNLLVRVDDLSKVIQETEIPNLSIITSGPLPPNPSELIDSQRMKDLLVEFRNNFDYVLIDSPPLVSVTDPTILSTLVDATLLIINSKKTNREFIIDGINHLKNVQAKVLGVILNEVTIGHNKYYYYKYYGEEKV
ncbi:MAG: polysaccharide biosynthesis tyrosine autokinase [bacterium]